MVFPHCFTHYILYEKLSFFKEIIFHKFSSYPYGPLKKVMCFKLISPGFFRKGFIAEDLLDIHEKPFEKAKQKWKRLFLYFCTVVLICKCTVVFKLKIYNLQMFSRPSDIKCSFVSSNFVLFRIIRTAEVYSKPSRTSTMELFAQISKGFHPRYSTGLWIRLWIASFGEYFASLSLSSLCYCIKKENS